MSILIDYDKSNNIHVHVEHVQEPNFIRIKNMSNYAGRDWGLGVGRALGIGGEGYGPWSRKLKFMIKSQAADVDGLCFRWSHMEWSGSGSVWMLGLNIGKATTSSGIDCVVDILYRPGNLFTVSIMNCVGPPRCCHVLLLVPEAGNRYIMALSCAGACITQNA